jgi:hypothetical protein
MPIYSSFVPPAQTHSWGFGGTLAVGSHNHPWRPRRKIRITHLDAVLRTVPTGAAVLVDLNNFNVSTGAETSILASSADRLNVAVSTRADTKTLAVPVSVLAGDAIVPEIDQVGSTIAGAHLTVTIRYEEDLT